MKKTKKIDPQLRPAIRAVDADVLAKVQGGLGSDKSEAGSENIKR